MHLGDFNVQDLANTAWAFATANQQDAQLFAALARTAKWRVGDFNVQELANTAWAFATSNQSNTFLKHNMILKLSIAYSKRHIYSSIIYIGR